MSTFAVMPPTPPPQDNTKTLIIILVVVLVIGAIWWRSSSSSTSASSSSSSSTTPPRRGGGTAFQPMAMPTWGRQSADGSEPTLPGFGVVTTPPVPVSRKLTRAPDFVCPYGGTNQKTCYEKCRDAKAQGRFSITEEEWQACVRECDGCSWV